MNELGAALTTALSLIAALDGDLVEIVGLSLRVSLTAVTLAAAVGLPLGPRPSRSICGPLSYSNSASDPTTPTWPPA